MSVRVIILSLVIVAHLTHVEANNKVDSLMAVLNVAKGEERVNVLNELSWQLKFSDMPQAIEMAEQSLALAEQLPYMQGEAEALRNMSVLYSIKNDFTQSDLLANQAIDKFKALKDMVGIAKCYNVIGLNNNEKGNYQLALKHYTEALKLVELVGDSSYIIKLKGNIANVDYRRGNLQSALEVYESILKIARAIKDKETESLFLGNTARVHFKLGQYPEALEILYRSNSLNEDVDNQSAIANNMNDIGLIFLHVGMVREAVSAFRRSLELFESVQSQKKIGMAHHNLASCYFDLDSLAVAEQHERKAYQIYSGLEIQSIGNILISLAIIHKKKKEYTKALELLDQARERFDEQGAREGLAHINSNKGKIFMTLQDFEQAEQYLTLAQTQWEELGIVKRLRDNSMALAELYESMGDAVSALEYTKVAQMASDSMSRIEEVNALMQVKIKEVLKHKNAKVIELESCLVEKSQKLKRSRSIILILLLSIPFIIWGWYEYKQRIKRQKSELSDAIDSLEREILRQKEEQQGLATTVEQNNLEMTYMSLDLVQKDKFLHTIKSKLQRYLKGDPDNKAVKNVVNSIDIQAITNKEWEPFRDAFNKIYPQFFDDLFKQYPDLSRKELRHCGLIRLNILPREVAAIMGVSVSSIHKTRYRLRSKFGLQRQQSLEEFIAGF